MNLRIARILSIGGMLATAGAVTLSTQGLGSTPASASASSSSTATTSPSASSPASTAAAATPAIVAVSPTPVPGSTTQVAYAAGDAATLVFDTADGGMRLVAFAPNPGWVTVRIDSPTATQLEARLESPSGQVRFVANLVDGAVVAELETTAAAPGSSAPGTSGPDSSAPGNSAPGNSAPGNSAPGNSAPGNSAAGNQRRDECAGGDGDAGDGGGGGGDDNGGDDNGGGGGDDSVATTRAETAAPAVAATTDVDSPHIWLSSVSVAETGDNQMAGRVAGLLAPPRHV